MLASRGAAIQELNIVRKTLSVLKGGGLAQLAHPAQVTTNPVCPEITLLSSKQRFNQLARFLSILSEQLCTLFWDSPAEI